MQTIMVEEKLQKVASFNGIDIYHISADKFKTNTINIFFHDSINRENAARNALLPAVLRRGTEKLPSLQEIALYLEEQYGAVFDCGVVKKGERQIIQFYLEYVADRYTGENANLFENTFGLLFDIITKPVLEGNAFRKDYTEQEKENLRKLIESRINDKAQYAVDRCFEEMCKDEPFGIYEYGNIEDLKVIDNVNLYEYYRYFLKSLPVTVFITGNITDREIETIINRFKTIERNIIKMVDISFIEKDVAEVRNVTEKMNVNQGKFSMGLRTNTSANDSDYYALLVYNGILGGGIHSKLFQNVREKESLAYYVFSRLEKFKGLMVISSGIEASNKDKAMDIILKQIDEINKGNISDYEFDSTIRYIENGIKSLRDSQLQIVDFYLSQVIVDGNDDFNSIITKSQKVTRDDVVNISKKIKLDTVYFLTSESQTGG